METHSYALLSLQELGQQGPETALCEWLQTSDGVRHCLRSWAGKHGFPVIMYVHGIEGHGRWFETTAFALAAEGMYVYALDRRGAGASEGVRGHFSSYKQILADILTAMQLVDTRHPNAPLFLIANCWGAKPATVLCSDIIKERIGSKLKGLILTSPAFGVCVDVSFITKLKILVSYLKRDLRYFPIPLKMESFTNNPSYLDYITNDPLRVKEVTAAFFIESIKLDWLVKYAAHKLRVPLLILQAGVDEIVSVKAVSTWFNRVIFPDKTMQILSDVAHSLDFHHNPYFYHKILTKWIWSHVVDKNHEV